MLQEPPHKLQDIDSGCSPATAFGLFVAEGRGEKIKNDFFQTRKGLFELVDEPMERTQIEKNLPTKVGVIPEDSDKISWEEYAFAQMPVAAVLPFPYHDRQRFMPLKEMKS